MDRDKNRSHLALMLTGGNETQTRSASFSSRVKRKPICPVIYSLLPGNDALPSLHPMFSHPRRTGVAAPAPQTAQSGVVERRRRAYRAGRVAPACLREVREETGYTLPAARFAGLLTWEGFEIADGGLYLFTAAAPPGEPAPCSEGALAWQPLAWMFTAPEVVSNLHFVGPAIFDHNPPQVYHFIYERSRILRHVRRPLPAWVDVERPPTTPA